MSVMMQNWIEAAESAMVEADGFEQAANHRFARQSSRFAGGYYMAASNTAPTMTLRLELMTKSATCYRRGRSPDAKKVQSQIDALTSLQSGGDE